MKAQTKPIPKPSGVWIAIETVNLGHRQIDGTAERLVGVFDTYDLAETACQGAGQFSITNIEPGQSYRGNIINWRTMARVKA